MKNVKIWSTPMPNPVRLIQHVKIPGNRGYKEISTVISAQVSARHVSNMYAGNMVMTVSAVYQQKRMYP